jgi:phosphotransferase system enzyme I (PtsI)
MNPIYIPRVKNALRAVDLRTVRKAVARVLDMRSAQEVEEYLIETLLAKHPGAFLMGH